MKRLMFFIIIPFSCYSQNRIKGIIQSENEAIPYAKVYLSNLKNGTLTDENGIFELDLINEISASIIVKSNGFETQEIKCSSSDSLIKIELKQKVNTISPVVIHPKYNLLREVKKYSKESKLAQSTYVLYPHHEQAILYTNPLTEKGYIKTISLFLPSIVNELAHFRLNLYEVNKIDQSPGESILNKDIIVIPKGSNKWIDIDIDSFNFSLPKNGFYIGIEALPFETFKEIQRNDTTSSVNRLKFNITNYPLSLGAGRNKTDNTLFYYSRCTKPTNYCQSEFINSWRKHAHRDLKHIALKIELSIESETKELIQGVQINEEKLEGFYSEEEFQKAAKIKVKKSEITYLQHSVEELLKSISKSLLSDEDWKYSFVHLMKFSKENIDLVDLAEIFIDNKQNLGFYKKENRIELNQIFQEFIDNKEKLELVNTDDSNYVLKLNDQRIFLMQVEGKWFLIDLFEVNNLISY